MSALELNFALDVSEFGETKTVELKPGGKDILVTNDNRIEYIHLLADFKLNRQINEQVMHFRNGMADVIDLELLRLFNFNELQNLISGADESIDVDDWKVHTVYSGNLATVACREITVPVQYVTVTVKYDTVRFRFSTVRYGSGLVRYGSDAVPVQYGTVRLQYCTVTVRYGSGSVTQVSGISDSFGLLGNFSDLFVVRCSFRSLLRGSSSDCQLLDDCSRLQRGAQTEAAQVRHQSISAASLWLQEFDTELCHPELGRREPLAHVEHVSSPAQDTAHRGLRAVA